MTLVQFLSLASGLALGLLAAGQGRAQSGPLNTPEMVAAAGTRANPDSVFVNPEVRPQFVGGDKAFREYLTKNMRHPQQATRLGISGRVLVRFTLSATGKVQDVHVVSGPGNGLNDEALRLVWMMPRWEPARSQGQPVRVACTLPINFN